MQNIGILAHVDAGKTTLTEQMLYTCGVIRQAGRVDDGTTQTDWLEIERARGISVRAAQASLRWRDVSINLLDTPGHLDFAGEVERSLAALDGAVLVVSAVEGIQSHTETLWRGIHGARLPRVIFINKIDRIGSRSQELLGEIRQRFPGYFLPLYTLSGEETRECGVAPDPGLDERMAEAAAEFRDDIALRWLEGEMIPREELEPIVASLTARGDITPVVWGSSALGVGVEALLDTIAAYLPNAAADDSSAASGLIFKVEHDRSMGKIAHIRMYGGKLRTRDTVIVNSSKGGTNEEEQSSQKITQIRKFSGFRYADVGEVAAGDIAAVYGLSRARVGDFLGDQRPGGEYHFANPFFRVKVQPKDAAKLTELVSAMRELSDEEPLIDCRWEKSERELDINITGEIQLEVIAALLRERYGIEAVFSPPTVIYKETPIQRGEGFSAYTMPKPCWAVVRFLLEPGERGSGVRYDPGRVPHNTLFYKYQEHIKTCFHNCLEQGIQGWEVTDFKATLIGGEHHTLHTHPLDFFVATPMAFMNGLVNTGTKLLEPFLLARISAPEAIMGKVVGDIIKMRGSFDTPVVKDGVFHLECCLPVATSMEYPVQLAAMSGGRGNFSSRFDSYRDCPEGVGEAAPFRGVNPLDRSKWILYKRGAYTE